MLKFLVLSIICATHMMAADNVFGDFSTLVKQLTSASGVILGASLLIIICFLPLSITIYMAYQGFSSENEKRESSGGKDLDYAAYGRIILRGLGGLILSYILFAGIALMTKPAQVGTNTATLSENFNAVQDYSHVTWGGSMGIESAVTPKSTVGISYSKISSRFTTAPNSSNSFTDVVSMVNDLMSTILQIMGTSKYLLFFGVLFGVWHSFVGGWKAQKEKMEQEGRGGDQKFFDTLIKAAPHMLISFMSVLLLTVAISYVLFGNTLAFGSIVASVFNDVLGNGTLG